MSKKTSNKTPYATPLGKSLDHQARQITYNVYSYFKQRKLVPGTYEHQNDINLINTVATVTGLSKSTVSRVIRAGNHMKYDTGTVCFKPEEPKKHIRKKRIEIDRSTEGVIRRKVIQYYKDTKEVPSIRKLNAILKQEKILNCSNEYLRQLLHRLGFTNSDDESEAMVIERKGLFEQRRKYIEAIKEYRTQNRSIFFFNDTSRWTEYDDVFYTDENMPAYIILHVSGSRGFIDHDVAKIKNVPKEASDDDERNMAFENYEWVQNTVIPKMCSKSVVVMNTPHCEIAASDCKDEKPTMASTRTAMQNWLKKHNIPFKETDAKIDLFNVINGCADKLEYSIDKLLKQHDHEVIYLPQDVPDLNPALIACDNLKETEGMNSIVLLRRFSKQDWQKIFEKVRENEDEYYVLDMKTDATGDHFEQVEIKKEKDDADMEYEQ